jgi:hypothetical protein
MTTAKKDVIYIDADDEITSVIEKVQSSKTSITAVVLPKRATVLQSIVNMRLLKRAGDDAEKRVVLITSESALMPLAGAVGMYVAKNLQSKPEIPPAPNDDKDDEDVLEDESNSDDTQKENQEDDVFEEKDVASGAKKPKLKKPQKSKKPKIPNFDNFRKKVLFGVLGGVGLIVALYFAFFVAPKATITLKTENSTSNNTIEFTASNSADTQISDSLNILASKQAEKEQTDSQKANATGEKDLGAKATGTVTFSIDCADVDSFPLTVPSGTGVSAEGLTFITQASAVLSTPGSGGGCSFTGSAKVSAQNKGEQYNISATSYSVSGYSKVSGSGTAMTGGSSKIAKVVSQQDVDSATDKIKNNSDSIKQDLQKELEDQGYYALIDTFETKDESIKVEPKVGQEANEVTVTSNNVYVMHGVKRDDLKALVEQSIKSEAEEKSLQLQQDGLDQAVFRVIDSSSDETKISMQVQVVLGPKIDETALKQELTGKKKGDIINRVKEINGVKDAEVSLSPFWVSVTPKSPDKIILNYEEAL